MSKLYLYFILCFLLGVCVGQIVQVGQCDNNIALYSNLSLEAVCNFKFLLLQSVHFNLRFISKFQ